MRIVSFVSALLILCSTLAVPAMAAEVWVVDLDSSPVVVSEDGTQTPVASENLADPNFSLLDPEPEVDTTPAEAPSSAEDPSATEDPVSAVEPSVSDLEEEDPLPTWDEYMSEQASSYSVLSVADLDDPVYDSGSGESQTMKDVIVQVFGEYSPRTQTVTQYLSDGSVLDTATEIVPGVAGMDWQWISGVALFAVVLFSFLKMVGVLLKNG